MRFRLWAITIALVCGQAHANFHLWTLVELFSNADGSVQYVELRALTGGQQFVSGHTLTSASGTTTRTFTFPSNLPGDTAGKSMLIGTQGFAAIGSVAPDFVVPDGFFFQGGGTINFSGVDTWNHGPIPSNGQSLNRDGSTGIPSPQNFSNQTGTVGADLALTQSATPNPANAGKDLVFTTTASNLGPNHAPGTNVSIAYDSSAFVVWVSPGCTKQGFLAIYLCSAGTVASGTSAQFKLVLRQDLPGSTFGNASVGSSMPDPVSANNGQVTAVTVNATPPGIPIQRYRLFSPVTHEHHFTTDLNEYNVLGGNGNWNQEGTVGRVLDNPGLFNGVTAVPYYRLYNTASQQHHWTTDANEYYTLVEFPQWNAEGVDAYILPSNTAGATQLYRLLYPFVAGLHHWTIDANEYNTLIGSYGWVGEGGTGFVIP